MGMLVDGFSWVLCVNSLNVCLKVSELMSIKTFIIIFVRMTKILFKKI